MESIGVLEARNSLSSLIRRIESGAADCIVITRNGRPAAKVVPYSAPAATDRIGAAAGRELCLEGWDSPEANAEAAALFGATA